MFLCRMSLAPRARRDPEFWELFDHPYAVHQAVWHVYSDSEDRSRDFLYRVESRAGRPVVYALSPRQPVNGGGLWRIETKRFAPQIEAGDLLDFTLRANPVVTRNGKRHDVVMDAKAALKSQDVPPEERPSQAELVQEHGSAWLERRAGKHGFSVVEGTLRVEGHQIHRFEKRSGRQVHIATCDFRGVLRAEEPDRLVESIRLGIGPAKGFGCGLLLIRRHRS